MALGPVKPYVKSFADALAAMFGFKTLFGWRATDQFPDHPSGHAVDFSITDIGTGGVASRNPEGKAAGDALANYATTNAKILDVKYVIWNHRIWTPEKGWHEYTQEGQGPHDDHVHVTWNDTEPAGGIQLPGYTPVSNGLLGGIADATYKKIEGASVTLAVALLGLGLIGAGLWVAVSPKVQKAVSSLPGIGG